MREAFKDKIDNIKDPEDTLSPNKKKFRAKSKKNIIPNIKLEKIEESINPVKKWDIIKFAEKCFYVLLY